MIASMRRGYHDIGGLPRGKIDTTEHDVPGWAMELDCIRRILNDRYRVDEQRRIIEELGEDKYDRLTYFELRVEAMARILQAKDILEPGEIERRMQEITGRNAG